ncbi:MAG: helix-turn-helix domain-containing protein [Oscillospiraceae bacterium]|nr:helix-turn-helix domain-containing protein [Oscillospiraceae bacterium]
MEQQIKALRAMEGLTQAEFGSRIGVRGSTIANYETGVRTPSEAVILSVCREFDVSEHWLRTGEGEMYMSRTEDEALGAFFGEVLSGEADFRRRLLGTLSRLTPEQWRILEEIAEDLRT